MGKGSKVVGTIFLLLGIGCIAMYFLMGNKETGFKVTFDSNGGTIIPEQLLKEGEKATKPANPTKENSEFLEWQLDGTTYNFDNVVTKDITLKAIWNDIINHTIILVIIYRITRTVVCKKRLNNLDISFFFRIFALLRLSY